MAIFIPKEIKDNVNISKEPPLKEFFSLLLSLCAIVIISYFILGVSLSFFITKMPEKFENTISRFYDLDKWDLIEQEDPFQKKTQDILDRLVVNLSDRNKEYQVFVVDDNDANAFALPGGKILVLSGLIEEVGSENELAYVLAHELGHYANNDHLKALSRGIVLAFISAVLFGNDSSVTNLVSSALTTLDMKFSREQEARADQFGLRLLNQTYGHVAGATEFFERMKEKEELFKYFKFFLTHPLSEERVKAIEQLMAEYDFQAGEIISLDIEEINKGD